MSKVSARPVAKAVKQAVPSAGQHDLSRPILNSVNYLALAYFGAIIIALIVFGSSPWLYGLFAVFAFFFILPYHYLSGMAAIIVLTLFFERYFALQGLVIDRQTYKFYLLDIVICLTFFAWLLTLIADKAKLKMKIKNAGWPEYLLVAWLTLVAIWLIRSLFDINADFAVAFSSFKNYFFYPLLYLLFAFAASNEKKLRDFIHLYLYAAVGLLIFLAIGIIRGVGLWTEFTPLSTAGVRYLAGTHAFYLCLALVIASTLLIYRRLRQPVLSITIMSLWSLGVVFSLMRHLYLALFVGLASLFFLVDKKSRKVLWHYARVSTAVLASTIVGIILISSLAYYAAGNNNSTGGLSALSARLGTIYNLGEDTSASWRAQLWFDAKNEWLKSPLIGSGFGHTVLIETADYQNFEEIRNIHNSPLAITVQMGIIGIVAFAAFVLSVLYLGFKNIRRHPNNPYAIGVFAASLIFIAASFFQPYLETNLMGIWLWIFLGLVRASELIES